MLKCGWKNNHQKETCFKEMGLCTQHFLTTINPTIKWGHMLYVQVMKKSFIRTPKTKRKTTTNLM
jgi:hypothetical protein